MASAEFNGFKNVSGTISKTSYRDKDGLHTTRVIAKVINGKQRIYIRKEAQRKTKVSEGELKRRALFVRATDYVKEISPDVKKQFEDEWMRSKYLFNGKVYYTLRGYIIARFYAEHKDTSFT